MHKNLIALPLGKATGLPAYRYGAGKAIEILDNVRTEARAGKAVSPYWLTEALNGLPPESRRGFLVVTACYLAAASAVADDIATQRKVNALMAALDNKGGIA